MSWTIDAEEKTLDGTCDEVGVELMIEGDQLLIDLYPTIAGGSLRVSVKVPLAQLALLLGVAR